MISMHDPADDTGYGFMFDILCNEHRYTPLEGHKVLDLGAHFGFFSLFCANRGANVVAYEPDPDNFERLKDAQGRAAENGTGTIEIHERAVGISDAQVMLYRDHHSGTSNICNLGQPRSVVRVIPFEMVIAGREWDCVKMDIESAEFEVLTNARKEDLKQIKYLTLELHNHIGSSPQPRYEALMKVLHEVYSVHLMELRDGRYCKAFCTRK